MHNFRQQLSDSLIDRKKKSLYRYRVPLSSAQSTEINIDGSQYLCFCSNDYLGLANHPDVIQSFKNAAEKYGVGSGASHLITGHSEAHNLLEIEIARFTGRDRALLFSSGYMANIGVINCLISKGDSIFEDKLNHASLLDGGLSSGAKFKRYSHLNMGQLQQQLAKNESEGRTLIVSDGIFSMDGDIAKLPELIHLSSEEKTLLMIDDAHGFGCLGEKGGGIVAHYQEQGSEINQDNLPMLIGTLGKAFGTSGAFVAGSEELIETLIQFCRPYIYTTAMPPAIAEASRTSLRIIQKDSWRREKLRQLITIFRESCQSQGFSLLDSITPIQCLIIGDAEKALEASALLKERGIFVSAIRPPTVPKGSARLRITFSANHSEEQVQRLLSALNEISHLCVNQN